MRVAPFFIMAVLLGWVTPAWSEDFATGQASIVRSSRREEQVKELKWKSSQASWKEVSTGVAAVTLEGSLSTKATSLVIGGKQIPLKPEDGSFRFKVLLRSQKTPLTLHCIDAFGVVRREKVTLIADDWVKIAARAQATREHSAKSGPGGLFFAGAGVSFISYEQTDERPLSLKALTLKSSYTRPIGASKWDIGVTGFVTLLPVSTNRSDVSLRFLGVNGRLGYALPFVRDPWRLSTMIGFYYTTTLVSGTPMGYRDVGGPMLFPVLRRALPGGQSLSAYLKYSPINNGARILAPSSRELAAGAAWTRPIGDKKLLSVTLDFSDLVLSSEADFRCRTITAGLAFGW